MIIVVLAVSSQFLPRWDSGYRQTYWLGSSDKYEIPWQYGPYNGSLTAGGTYFLVRVSGHDLTPIYEMRSPYIIVGKATNFDLGKNVDAPGQTCTEDAINVRCQWKHGEFVYDVSGSIVDFPKDRQSLMNSVANLLDSFMVSEEQG
ncbi:hypothetical protein [Roseibium sp. RKSG952]|uniref:hypothetical protein n=1 Tax=Roseibium sp. RKSG952 TaxID=2529384 RepID=UPI0012BBA067|nr:hypothetical protein [Roseibium sp. RKSG952]MTI01781.1 hypothetical protein [Roseibium sp. RKSG952]